jgi:hypothetical protein
VERTIQVDRAHAVPRLGGELGERLDREQAGIVDEDVQAPAGALQGTFEAALDRGEIANVHLERQPGASRAARILGRRFDLAAGARGDDCQGPLAREAQRDRAADAAPAAGHQDRERRFHRCSIAARVVHPARLQSGAR